MTLTAYLLIIFAALGGFLLAAYIRYHKKSGRQRLVCPLGHDCDSVIHSEYSLFFGIPVELLGLVYYGFVAVSYGIFLILPSAATPFFVFSVLVLTTVAFLFSLYLTFIQAFVLREWCTWCLMSAGFCAVIFALALFVSEMGFIELLAGYHNLIAVAHLIVAAIGLGSATVADVMFFKFLKDFKISQFEADVLKILSQVIWFVLGVILITGLGLYLPESAELNQNPKFLAKMLVFLVIIVNGAFLNLLITPNLVKVSFGRKHRHASGELHRIRKLAFTLGSVSIVSWYSAFILGALRAVPLSFGTLLAIYLLLILIGIVLSQFFEHSFVLRSGE